MLFFALRIDCRAFAFEEIGTIHVSGGDDVYPWVCHCWFITW